MQANWNLILNILMLVGVVAAIGRLMKTRRQGLTTERYQPNLGDKSAFDEAHYHDDIIAIRKVNIAATVEDEPVLQKSNDTSSVPQLIPAVDDSPVLKTESAAPRIELVDTEAEVSITTGPTLMLFLLAKESRQFAGYELLQTVLAAGLRFGEGNLFHRHQFSNGDGPVLCSLAAATATGVFDLQNIGAFSVRGLCLYMQSSNNSQIDAERFAIMLDTAHQLSEGLDAFLLDDQRRPLTEERIAHYYNLLGINPASCSSIVA